MCTCLACVFEYRGVYLPLVLASCVCHPSGLGGWVQVSGPALSCVETALKALYLSTTEGYGDGFT